MNGTLLAVAEEAGCEVLLSGDRSIKGELLIGGRKIGMVCMSDNRWPAVAESAGFGKFRHLRGFFKVCSTARPKP